MDEKAIGHILAIDPGPKLSAVVEWDGTTIHKAEILPNEEMLTFFWDETCRGVRDKNRDVLVVEQVASYGMAVGESVFETVFWSGRFIQEWAPLPSDRLKRLPIKQHLCHDSRAKDSNIRQALIDRFGKPGTKKKPGLTYGIKKDLWAALALAVTWWDQNTNPSPPLTT